MRSIGVRYLVARPRKGGTAWYWQPTPKLIAAGFLPRRLPDETAKAVAQAELLNAELDRWYDGISKPPAYRPDGLEALDVLFQRDDQFRTKLKPRTQADYLRNIRVAIEWAGDSPVSAISRKAIKEWHRGLSESRGAATARNNLAALRRLLSFAVDEEWIPRNPALAMLIAVPGSRSRVWSVAERDTFCAAAIEQGRASMALAVMLGWCIGQRPGDLRSLTWAAYDGRMIRLKQAKTDSVVGIPCHPELRILLDSTPRAGEHIVINEETVKPYLNSAFEHVFARVRKRAGMAPDLQFRDLRRTLATALGAAGCTDDQIRAITGHKTRAVVAVYVRPDDTYAEGAMKRLRAAERNLSRTDLKKAERSS